MKLSTVTKEGGRPMSLKMFITDMLNIELSEIESLNSISHSDGSIVIKVKLCRKENVSCPHGFYYWCRCRRST